MWTLILLKMATFMLLVPGVLFTLPSKGSSFKEKVVLHSLIFVIASSVVYWYILPSLERFSNPDSRVKQKCPGMDGMYVQLPSGDCVLKTDVNVTYKQ